MRGSGSARPPGGWRGRLLCGRARASPAPRRPGQLGGARADRRLRKRRWGGWGGCKPLPRGKRNRCGRRGAKVPQEGGADGKFPRPGSGDSARGLSAAVWAGKRWQRDPTQRGAPSRVPTAACNGCSHSPRRLSSSILFGNVCSIFTPFPFALLRAAPFPRGWRPRARKLGSAASDSPKALGEEGRGAGGRARPADPGLRPRRGGRRRGRAAGGGPRGASSCCFSLAGAEVERWTGAETGQCAGVGIGHPGPGESAGR